MEKIMVVGAGFMGTGIAQVCAQAGYDAVLMDVNQEALIKATAGIKWSLKKFESKGMLKETAQTVMDRIVFTGNLDQAVDSRWVIEAAFEEQGLKERLLGELDQMVSADAILASNTSSIPITQLAKATSRPERVVGLHFFGPVPFMALVEVVRGEHTSEKVFEKGVQFIKSLGKTPVKVHKDIPGFVMNRIFGAAFRECVDLVAEGIASPEDIDIGMRLGYGWNIGPFEIADNAGLDTFARVGESMLALGEDQLVARPDFINKMVVEGRLGKKARHGFYRYTKDGKKIT